MKDQIRATQLMHRHAAFQNCSSPPHSAGLAANMMHYIPAAAAPPAGGVRVGPGGTAMPSTFLMRRDSAAAAGSVKKKNLTRTRCTLDQAAAKEEMWRELLLSALHPQHASLYRQVPSCRTALARAS